MRGGYGSSPHGTMAERVAGHLTPSPPISPARHCHVDGEPGLLVEWRRVASGWQGRVLSMVWIDAVGWATVERWLPAGDITSDEPRTPPVG